MTAGWPDPFRGQSRGCQRSQFSCLVKLVSTGGFLVSTVAFVLRQDRRSDTMAVGSGVAEDMVSWLNSDENLMQVWLP